MTHMTRVCLVPVIAALGLAAAPAPAPAQNAPQCVVSGSPPAGWGFNSVGYIEIASGSSCVFSVNITGEVTSSSVSQNPAHGTLQHNSMYLLLCTHRRLDIEVAIPSPSRRPATVRPVPATLCSPSTLRSGSVGSLHQATARFANRSGPLSSGGALIKPSRSALQ